MSKLLTRISLVLLWSLLFASSTNLFAQTAAEAKSPSILANGTLYISAQSGRKSDGSLAGDWR